MFVDRVRINVTGGSGGAGVASFVRRKGQPRGKPSGGSGGRGGDVILVAEPGTSTLLRYDRKPHWTASDGTHGEGDSRHGRAGDDLVLPVPLGTVVRDADDIVIADLVEPGQSIVVARGGRGGRGNAALAGMGRKAPTFAEQGEYAEPAWITLELKLIADAALIGFPNAGKSTLISRVSAARPKIADYPFTTLEPHLGVVDVGGHEFVLADIPGLIEGAADGRGLGHEFLRHTERARVLVVLLDPSPLQTDGYAEQYDILIAELAAHSPELAQRPRLVALNKTDVVPDVAEMEQWADERGFPLHAISAVTGEGLDRLMYALSEQVKRTIREAPDRQGYVLHRPVRPGFSVTRDGDVWVVSGRAAERAVALDDLTVLEAADFAAERLARLGVDEALRAAGAEAGDDVRIGDLVFTYEPREAPVEETEVEA
jgi:GTP-binding protein